MTANERHLVYFISFQPIISISSSYKGGQSDRRKLQSEQNVFLITGFKRATRQCVRCAKISSFPGFPCLPGHKEAVQGNAQANVVSQSHSRAKAEWEDPPAAFDWGSEPRQCAQGPKARQVFWFLFKHRWGSSLLVTATPTKSHHHPVQPLKSKSVQKESLKLIPGKPSGGYGCCRPRTGPQEQLNASKINKNTLFFTLFCVQWYP